MHVYVGCISVCFGQIRIGIGISLFYENVTLTLTTFASEDRHFE